MTSPEKSTNQLAVWRELVEALDQLDSVWGRTQAAGPHTTATVQLPAYIATALAKSLDRGAATLAGAAQVLAAQHDSGRPFQTSSDALRTAADNWPRSTL